MSLIWTRQIPTKPGFYYWQGGRLEGLRVAIAQVTGRHNPELPLLVSELCANGFKNAPHDGVVESWGGIWAGPLPQPYHN